MCNSAQMRFIAVEATLTLRTRDDKNVEHVVTMELDTGLSYAEIARLAYSVDDPIDLAPPDPTAESARLCEQAIELRAAERRLAAECARHG